MLEYLNIVSYVWMKLKFIQSLLLLAYAPFLGRPQEETLWQHPSCVVCVCSLCVQSVCVSTIWYTLFGIHFLLQFGIHFLFCPFLFHTMSNCNQTSVIDATWEPSYVNEVKGHIPRSKVIRGQDVYVKVAAYVKLITFVHFFSIQ